MVHNYIVVKSNIGVLAHERGWGCHIPRSFWLFSSYKMYDKAMKIYECYMTSSENSKKFMTPPSLSKNTEHATATLYNIYICLQFQYITMFK